MTPPNPHPDHPAMSEQVRGGVAPAGLSVADVALYREVDALGGTPDSEWSRGYCQAIDDVLAILSRRGFGEHSDGFAFPPTAQVAIADVDRRAAAPFDRYLSGANSLGNLRFAFARHRSAAEAARAQVVS